MLLQRQRRPVPSDLTTVLTAGTEDNDLLRVVLNYGTNGGQSGGGLPFNPLMTRLTWPGPRTTEKQRYHYLWQVPHLIRRAARRRPQHRARQHVQHGTRQAAGSLTSPGLECCARLAIISADGWAGPDPLNHPACHDTMAA
jgi:hypothetical protein